MTTLTKGGLKKTSITVDPQHWDQLRFMAATRHTNPTCLLREAIELWLVQQTLKNRQRATR